METPPRPIITKMVLENFKSYAGIKEIGPFHKSFSSVVGPNGSGKSNVIDAMLFVFGKRAKQMRQSKVSQLIHSSKDFPSLELASVTVYFAFIIDHGDGFDVLPDSEFTIKRTATIDNKSNYYIDDKSSNYKNVTDRVKEIGIDLNTSRFLILQGEVEQISLMKPKAPTPHETGMLEYLEEIIGTYTYVPMIEEAATEVDSLNELRSEKVNRLKTGEKELSALVGSKEEAEEYIQTEANLSAYQACVYQKHGADASLSAAEVCSKTAELEEALQVQQNKKVEILASEKDLGKQYKAATKKYDDTAKEMQAAKENFAVCERKDVKCREDLKHNKAKQKKLNAAIAKDNDKADKLQSQMEQDQTAIEPTQAELATVSKVLAKEVVKVDEILAGLKECTEPFRLDIEKVEQSLQPLDKALSEATSKLQVSQAELELVTQRVSSGSTQLEAAEAERVEKQGRIAEAENAVTQCEKAIGAAQKKIAKLSKDAERLSNEEDTCAKQLKTNRASLDEQLRAAEKQRVRGGVLNALMSAQSKGKLKNILGRLGDLGTIDAKYDVAITTACNGLDNMVTETTQAAQAAVAYLKKHKVGIASIMIKEQIKTSPQAMIPRETPEGVPRLFDLVRPADESLRPLFYQVLRDTLVARDLEQATRIAYAGSKRHRVVTLDGNLIDTSGTMAGGGNKPKRGGMSAVEALPAIDTTQLEAQVESEHAALISLREAHRAAQSSLKTSESILADNEYELSRAIMEAKEVTKQVASLEEHIKKLQKGVSAREEDIEQQAQLVQEVAGHQQVFDQATEEAGPVKAHLADLKEQMAQVGGGKLEKQKTKVKDLEAKMEELNTKLSKLQVQIQSSAKQIKTLGTSVKKKQDELDAVADTIKSTEDALKAIEDGALEVLQAYKDAEEALAISQQEVAAIDKDYESTKSELDSIESVEMDLTNQLDDKKRIIADFKKKETHWASELKKLRRDMQQTNTSTEGAVCDAPPCATASDAAESIEEAENSSAEKEKDDVGADEQTENADTAPDLEAHMLKALYVDLAQEVLQQLDHDRLQCEIATSEDKLASMNPDMGAIAEYRRKEQDYQERLVELDTVTEQRDASKSKLDSLRKQRLDDFMCGFGVISMKLKEMYQMITMGGDAELELVDSLDPFSEGIAFSVRPPKKSWKHITNLSGGEKTLSSLALVFALHHYKPTPLYVMDEIDAALDFKNVSIVANYIKDRTKNAQFIIISLRNNMFELADRLVGIYKTNDCTKSITINPSSFAISENPATLVA